MSTAGMNWGHAGMNWCHWKGIPRAAVRGALMEEAQPGHPLCFLPILGAHLPLSRGWSRAEELSKPCGLLVEGEKLL